MFLESAWQLDAAVTQAKLNHDLQRRPLALAAHAPQRSTPMGVLR